jgi:hypothetical protein
MPVQLRIYTINRGSLRQFAEEWKNHVLPLRIEHGFQIDGAWLIEETNQFAWLMRYEGSESWEEKEQAYYSSADRKAVDPDPARLIARPEEFIVESIL